MPARNTVKLNFAGDICLSNVPPENFTFSDGLINVLQQADLNVGNFECTITESQDKLQNHVAHLKSDMASLNILRDFHCFSLANNHILDFNEEGYFDTINTLIDRGYQVFGSGQSQKQALTPLKMHTNNVPIAFLGATRFANATDNTPGTAKRSFRPLSKQITKLKADGYFVIVYLHWGYEYVPYPPPNDRRLAHKLIDVGADLLIGAHPHICQGYEVYRSKYIFYSLGNFIFHSSTFKGLSYIEDDPRLFVSYIVNASISRNGLSEIQLVPYRITDNAVSLLSGDDKTSLLNTVNRLSRIFNKSKIEYLKTYYSYAAEISERNVKIKKTYLFSIRNLSPLDYYNIYRKADLQDIANRLAGLVIGLLNNLSAHWNILRIPSSV